jgi:DNA topoisomerase-3
MKVDYKEGKSKLHEGKTSAEGCIYCDAELSQLVEKHHAVLMKRRVNHQGGGGRGAARGGRGGRGRGGRGGKAPKDKMAQLAAYFV